ncbi:MAG: hypothetical protein EBQ96_02745 [Proteobacteria bacterium]|nr:hypothetical protein [Pseudomonadota bacterium]
MGTLAGIASALSPILTGAGIPGAVVGFGTQYLNQRIARDDLRRQQDQALVQLQSKQRLDEEQSAQNATLEKQKIANETAANELRRRQALKRAVARQKTLFSAQGLGGEDAGSNEAVLLGLVNSSEEESAETERLANLRRQTLDQSLSQQKQKNLLESTQLAQRQSLARYILES